MGDGSWIGLVVHARSTVAAVIDGASGEVVVCRAPVDVEALAGWVAGYSGPVRAAYEAGPTGSGWRGRWRLWGSAAPSQRRV